ncbi:DsbE family thiol:disulfide interchange protein [Rhodobacteraceae bacterium WD3A24]|nr:DsbE family thiol:disulfide interchange protein [Rhodobacteraceae bacterium WD3A24]
MARISPLMMLPPLIFAGLAAVFYFGMYDDNEELPSAREGGPAPEVDLARLGDYRLFTGDELDDGEVSLVNYWASWCAPCRAEHPMLEQIAEEGIPIYGINYRDNPQRAMQFLDEVGNPFAAIGTDQAGQTAIDWGLYGVPETYVIDGDGTVVMRFAGPITPEILESRIRPAIERAGGG